MCRTNRISKGRLSFEVLQNVFPAETDDMEMIDAGRTLRGTKRPSGKVESNWSEPAETDSG